MNDTVADTQQELPPPPSPPPGAAAVEPSRAPLPDSQSPPPFLDEPRHDKGDSPTHKSTWYGSETLGTDGAALALVGLAVATESGGFAAGGLGTYVFGGPIVHWSHGNVGRGFGSLLLRGGLPITFAVAGSAMESCGPDKALCGLGGAVGGAALGILTAMIVDASLLAWDDHPGPTSHAGTAAPLRLHAGVSVTSQQKTLVLQGIF